MNHLADCVFLIDGKNIEYGADSSDGSANLKDSGWLDASGYR